MSIEFSKIQANVSKGDQQFKRSTLESFTHALDFYLKAAFDVVKKNWQLTGYPKIRTLAVADINNDGKDEVVFGTEGHQVFAVESECRNSKTVPISVWEIPFLTKDWVTGIAVLDIDASKDPKIIVASDSLYVLDNEGNKIDEYRSKDSLSSLQVYTDNNGNNIIATGDNKGRVTCYNFDFVQLWSIPFKKSDSKIIDIAVGDFDGDGKIEVAAASEDKFIYIIDCNGEEKDKIDVKHWIVNMADCKMKNSHLRLFIGKFTGETLVYKYKQTSPVASLKQSGILDLKVEYIFDDSVNPQFVVGSSDRAIYIFDYDGNPIWIFESGLGQRSIFIKKTGDGQIDLYVGTESGDIICYSICLHKELVSKICATYEKIKSTDLLDLKINPTQQKILRNYIEYNPINKDASLIKARAFKEKDDFNRALVSAMEVWFNNCNFDWSFSTQGRIYDISPHYFCKDQGFLIGSDDGILYCLNANGELIWKFHAQKDLFGATQGIRGVCVDFESFSVFTVSVDKSLYKLNRNGKPEWHFLHDDWILYACCGSYEKNNPLVFVGTEDGYVMAFDMKGLLIWKKNLGKRVRALSFCENFEGNAYLIAGCDDNRVYKLDKQGNFFGESISTPHYVLVVQSVDINGDGIDEILTGNEDGCLHVYDFFGNLLWTFKTESWVAALNVFNNCMGQKEIVIGSQDNHVYVLNQYGALLWQYETNARVRTIYADGNLCRIVFGSYDKNVYLLEQVDRIVSFDFLRSLYETNIQNPMENEEENTKKILLDSISNRHRRAFVYLFTKNPDILMNGLTDDSDIVLAAVGSNLVENFITEKKYEKALISLLVKTNQKVRIVILYKLIQQFKMNKIKKLKVSKIFSAVTKETPKTSSKIEIFRYWLTITNRFDDILHMTRTLLPLSNERVDDLLIDELNRVGMLVLQLDSNDCGDYDIIQIVENISRLISEKYPTTAQRLLNTFL